MEADRTDMEVSVTLNPLANLSDSDVQTHQVENHRHFKIHKEQRVVDVGRASKNPNKGLQSSADNAIFDCPILSRLHSQFTASPVKKELYIKDCESTHGTYIDKRRLVPMQTYPLMNGEIVTLGVKVTNGPLTYPPKSFRVNYKWQPRSLRLPEPSPVTSTLKTLGFVVPEESDDDCASQQSQDGSVQVIESHPRSYLVPSDDEDDSDLNSEFDDDIEIASSVEAASNVSVATTPEKTEKQQVYFKDVENDASNKDVRGLNLPGPSLPSLLSKPAMEDSSELKPSLQRLLLKPAQEGSTQLNPIYLEDPITKFSQEPDGETEDEGPEILPIHPSNETSISGKLQEKHMHRVKRSQASATEVRENIVDLDTSDPYTGIVLETQAEKPGEQEAKSKAKRSEVPNFEQTVSIADVADGFSSLDEDDEFAVDDEDFPIDEDEGLAYPSPLLQPCLSASASYNPTYQVPRKEPWTEVSLSARTAMLPQYSLLNENGEYGEGTISPNEPSLIQRAASPSDAALARKPSNSGTALAQSDKRQTVFGHTGTSGVRQEGQRELVNLLDHTNAQYNIPFSTMLAENASPKRNAYTSGPFSNRSNLEHPVAYDIVASRPGCYGSVNAVATREEQSPSHGKPQSQQDNSSRLNISNLVHKYYAEHPSPSLKRKAADISLEYEVGEATQTTSTPVTSQETPLPDAQPRDAPVHMDNSISQGDDMTEPLISSVRSIETPPNAGPSRKTVRDPFAQNNSVTQRSTRVASRTLPSEGPARKKAKTSSSRSTGGVGKFVSGICVGIVGALAAFIATIPASVKEEALRELHSVA